MTDDIRIIREAIKKIKDVADQCAFASYACAGDPALQNEMKMNAIWAGQLRSAIIDLSALDRIEKEGNNG